MSINCQYDVMSYPFQLRDTPGQVTVEAMLQLPPDAPRLRTVIGGDALVEPPRLTIMEGGVIVSGRVYPHLIYLAEEKLEAEARPDSEEEAEAEDSVERWSPPQEYGIGWRDQDDLIYETQINIPGLRPEMMVEADLVTAVSSFEKDSDDRVMLRCQIELMVHAAEYRSAGIIGNLSPAPAERINVTRDQVRMEEPAAIRREAMTVQAPLMLPNLKPGVARVLKQNIRPVGVTWELGRSKVTVKGFLEVAVIYVGSDDEGRPTEIFTSEWQRITGNAIPFETALDFEDLEEGMIVLPRVMIVRADLERVSHRELRAAARIEVEVKLSRVQTREMVVEVTPGSNEVIDTQKYLLETEEYFGESAGETELDLVVNLPFGLPGMERVLGWTGQLGGVTLEAADGKVLLEGKLHLQAVYTPDVPGENRLAVADWGATNGTELPVAGVIDSAGMAPGMMLRSYAGLENLNLELTGERSLRLTGILKVRIFARSPRAIMVMRDCALVQPVDPATRPSMLFYVVQPGDTLWKVARRYQTTTEQLARTNQILDPERIESGQKLLIPKPAAS